MDQRLLITTCLIGVVFSQFSLCPNDCLCYLDNRGRHVVECKAGGMVGPIDFTNISVQVEILKISAPEDNLNELSMSPQIQNFQKLEEVHITRSNIPNLGEKFFGGLSKLEVLNLSQNNITMPLPGNFQSLNNLKELFLDDNRIISLPSETFRYLTELRLLSVQKNRIDKLITGVFRGLAKLTVLKLNGNHITDFNPEAFSQLKELRVLECRGCALTSINPRVHSLLPYLTHLDLGENELKEINAADYAPLRKLKVFKFDGNQITAIPSKILPNHTDLKVATFARNMIKEVATDAFYNLVNMSELDLGYNKLEELDGGVVADLRESLERLVLSGNRLSLKTVKELLVGSDLRDLQLADGGITDVDESFLPESLVVLNLAGNQLSYIPAYVLPSNLRDLDLTRNMFRGLEGEVVERIEGMRCKLDNNPWSCDLCHIIPMLERVNKSKALYNVRCAFPYHHLHKVLGTIKRDQLSWCSAAGYSSEGANFFLSRNEGKLGLIAAGASALLLLFTAAAALVALCYSRRHAANYYTHEEKRALDEREAIFENQSPLFGEELSFKFPLDPKDKKVTIATIDEIKKEHAVTNGT